VTKPFPFPDGYWLDLQHKLTDRSLRDYVALFLEHRNERPGAVFADEDIEELMSLAEDLDDRGRAADHAPATAPTGGVSSDVMRMRFRGNW